MNITLRKLTDLHPFEQNAKKHPEIQVKQIARSIEAFGFNQPIVVDENNEIIVGHGRFYAAQSLKLKEVPVLMLTNLTDQQIQAYRLADNKLNESDWDMGLVIENLKHLDQQGFDITLTGFDRDLINDDERNEIKRSLQEDFIVPPFSIWDTKQEYWQKRKRMWIDYIGDSGTGRDDDLLGNGLKKLAQGAYKQDYKNETSLTGTSIFDPVVAELSYKWFSPENGKVFDPFAGGHVRGSVAEICGRKYTGIDLSKKQIAVNNRLSKAIGIEPIYINGDSENMDTLVPDKDFDFILSCPPYYDLEQYNDGEGDLSMLGSYDDFLIKYESVIKKSIEKLKENRFIVWVIGDIRDEKGAYRGIVSDTIDIFMRNGVCLYNEIILANAIATAPLRSRAPFSNRKVTKVHQNILCFFKGKPEVAKWYQNMPKMEKVYDKVLVFYKGEIDEIRKNYKFINTDLVIPNE